MRPLSSRTVAPVKAHLEHLVHLARIVALAAIPEATSKQYESLLQYPSHFAAMCVKRSGGWPRLVDNQPVVGTE
jgi:hypothetical protein